MNPFAHPSTLPYQAPPFDQIKDHDFEPALLDGMRQELVEIEAIATNPSPPTFGNTVLAMELGGQLLARVESVFFAMTSANTSDVIQKTQSDVAPKLAEQHDAIYMHPQLFRRVEAVYAQREGLEPESKWLVEKYHRSFVHSGARLSAADQATLRAINTEEASLTTRFEQMLLAATTAGALVVDDVALLAGLREEDIAAAAAAATARHLPGAWVVALQNTTQHAAQSRLRNRATRERLFRASISRAEKGDANDTRAITERLAALRSQKAKLLGFDTHAAYALQDQMAQTPERAIGLLSRLVPGAVEKARAEAAKMQALADSQASPGGRFELAPWDWQFYAEQVRKAEFALDDEQVKPYLDLNRVLVDGVFFAANRLYGISFKERHDLPVYQEDVRVFEVSDADGAPLALFYADYFSRDNKAGGAWMTHFVVQSRMLRASPVVLNVCNFTKPAPGAPALLSFDDVRTLFHEFGHALHGMFSNVQYGTLAGTRVPRDFVEFPSQFNEHWASEPTVFANFARHYETGEAMPRELVVKIEKARKFNQGFGTTEYLGAALLDMAWHTRRHEAAAKKGEAETVEAFEERSLKQFKVDFTLVPPRYRTTYFAHIWNGGYAGSYYAYLWAEVLDHDAFEWFVDQGGMTRENGQRFREMILSRGNAEELGGLYRAFRGRDPNVEPLMRARGLL